MINKDLKDVIMSLMFISNRKQLKQTLFQRFLLLLLSDIEIEDYEILVGHINAIKDFIGSEEV